MEMMELASQEILIFTKQIRHWILSDQVISGKRKLFFREDTPKEILAQIIHTSLN
ncbi:Uncharacterised protein [Streptococcus pneumoniae]|nr:Uncharacterised protein [Streptococcus pneumoniae]VNN54661.1 Uncharacterised protein [Streptococcus pneumoniae]VOP93599.1 Uncharacterised protein [Streptococcus pneumoniae]VRN78896.1 Uncharacterised protein [Streptococcus pneumoniae]VSQ70384.1 Uncharacterised protein [Streptococcus pneumoniae]